MRAVVVYTIAIAVACGYGWTELHFFGHWVSHASPLVFIGVNAIVGILLGMALRPILGFITSKL